MILGQCRCRRSQVLTVVVALSINKIETPEISKNEEKRDEDNISKFKVKIWQK